jgi:hypothetical protein
MRSELMRITKTRATFTAGWLALALALPAWGLGADDAEKLRQKQAAQEKARTLARELVSGILELQIRQLEENGLDRQPVMRDIREMQKHVDTISAKQMEEVVQLLVKAQEGSQKERMARFQDARTRVREIVVELMSSGAAERNARSSRCLVVQCTRRPNRRCRALFAIGRDTQGSHELERRCGCRRDRGPASSEGGGHR